MNQEIHRVEPSLDAALSGDSVAGTPRSGKAETDSDPRKYTRHRWKFLVFGAVSGVLMGIYSPGSPSPGGWISDLFGGLLLWYVLWRLWAWSRKRADGKSGG